MLNNFYHCRQKMPVLQPVVLICLLVNYSAYYFSLVYLSHGQEEPLLPHPEMEGGSKCLAAITLQVPFTHFVLPGKPTLVQSSPKLTLVQSSPFLLKKCWTLVTKINQMIWCLQQPDCKEKWSRKHHYYFYVSGFNLHIWIKIFCFQVSCFFFFFF